MTGGGQNTSGKGSSEREAYLLGVMNTLHFVSSGSVDDDRFRLELLS